MADPTLCPRRRRRCSIARPVAHAVASRLGSRGAFDVCALRVDGADGLRRPSICVARADAVRARSGVEAASSAIAAVSAEQTAQEADVRAAAALAELRDLADAAWSVRCELEGPMDRDAVTCDVTCDDTRNVTSHVTGNVTARAEVSRVSKLGPGRARCPGCGERYSSELAVLDAGLCCILAPPATGWCAWCGDELEEGRSFCGRACSIDYAADVAPDFAPMGRTRGHYVPHMAIDERRQATDAGNAAGGFLRRGDLLGY